VPAGIRLVLRPAYAMPLSAASPIFHPVPGVFTRRLVRASLPLLCAALSACASLSPEQCLHADWRQIGYADGVEGADAGRINDHAKACAEVGVKPNLDDYLRGREQGYEKYCRPANAFTLGRRGSGYHVDECQESMKPAFLYEYERGRQVYLIENDLAQRRSQIEQNHRQLRRSDERIGAIRGELARSDLPADRRTGLLNEFNRLVEDKNALSRENAFLYPEADRLQLRLQQKLREAGR
jgi:Protein of unknown function (DUF2799)